MNTKSKWLKALNSLIEPTTLIPIFIGVGFAFLVFTTCNSYVRTLLTVVSAVALGIGINYFTFHYKDEKEKEILRFKAEHTVRGMDLIIKSLLRRSDQVSREDRGIIDSLLNIIDYWKDYYDKADTSTIEKLRKLREEISHETDPVQKKEKQAILINLERDASVGGLTSFTPLSGGTATYK